MRAILLNYSGFGLAADIRSFHLDNDGHLGDQGRQCAESRPMHPQHSVLIAIAAPGSFDLLMPTAETRLSENAHP